MNLVDRAKMYGFEQLLRRQDGVIRRDQAYALGISRVAIDTWVRRGTWEALLPSVYRVENQGVNDRIAIRAASLWAGDASVITGQAAAQWCRWLTYVPRTIAVSVGPRRALKAQPGIVVQRSLIPLQDTVVEDGVRCTAVLRTALDLAAQDSLDLLDLLVRRRELDGDQAREALGRGRNRAGWSNSRSAVNAALSGNAYSAAEREAHQVFRDHGISGWVANPRMVICGHVLCPDMLFEAEMLVIEIDGYRYHGGREEFEDDRVRQNIFMVAGYTVLRFTWRQLKMSPRQVAAQVLATLWRLRNQ